MLDLYKIKQKINPPPDGQDVLRLRVATVQAVDSDGTVDITMVDGGVVPDVPVLGGSIFVVGSVVQVLSYRGSLLIIGAATGAASLPKVAKVADTDSGTTTSTGFTNTLSGTNGGIHGVAFIAPASGTVMVIGRASGSNNTAGQFSLLDFEVKTGSTVGSGSVFRSFSDVSCSSASSGAVNQFSEHCTTDLVTGLTPGNPYNAALTYRVTANTGAFNRRYISVIPQ